MVRIAYCKDSSSLSWSSSARYNAPLFRKGLTLLAISKTGCTKGNRLLLKKLSINSVCSSLSIILLLMKIPYFPNAGIIEFSNILLNSSCCSLTILSISSSTSTGEKSAVFIAFLPALIRFL